jgi:NitT/TauT family transport system ATP-binding protein
LSDVPETTLDSAALPPVVEFRNVSKTFHENSPKATKVIDNISFAVEDHPGHGEFIAILGPSGCGKSTILRMIAGLRPHFPATEGSVLVSGKPVDRPGSDRGMVFQDYTSFDNRTVEANIAFGLECQGVDAEERQTRAREWIARVGLDVDRDAHKYPQPAIPAGSRLRRGSKPGPEVRRSARRWRARRAANAMRRARAGC